MGARTQGQERWDPLLLWAPRSWVQEAEAVPAAKGTARQSFIFPTKSLSNAVSSFLYFF